MRQDCGKLLRVNGSRSGSRRFVRQLERRDRLKQWRLLVSGYVQQLAQERQLAVDGDETDAFAVLILPILDRRAFLDMHQECMQRVKQ